MRLSKAVAGRNEPAAIGRKSRYQIPINSKIWNWHEPGQRVLFVEYLLSNGCPGEFFLKAWNRQTQISLSPMICLETRKPWIRCGPIMPCQEINANRCLIWRVCWATRLRRLAWPNGAAAPRWTELWKNARWLVRSQAPTPFWRWPIS